jgi:hypothetical protein
MKYMKLTDDGKARALARFRSMRGRGGVRISFVAIGPAVPASDPEALGRATTAALVVATNRVDAIVA